MSLRRLKESNRIWMKVDNTWYLSVRVLYQAKVHIVKRVCVAVIEVENLAGRRVDS